MYRRSLIFFFVFLLAGCQTTQVTVTRPGSTLLPPQSFGRELVLNQQLKVTKSGQMHALDVLLEIHPMSIRLAGFSAGQKVMTFDYDGHTLQSYQHPFFPKTVTDRKSVV